MVTSKDNKEIEFVSNVSMTPVKHRLWQKIPETFLLWLFYLQFYDLSPENGGKNMHKNYVSGDIGYTGDKSAYIMEDDDKESNNRCYGTISKNCNCQVSKDPRIGHNHPLHYCKEHPKFENIHLEVIESHLILAKDHKVS